jgi:hypothetical protein
MTETDPELAAVLDAEYRELVRSLHKGTIAAVSRVDNWWSHHAFRVTIFAMSRDDDANDPELDERERIDREWRSEIIPTLLPLVNGHPDPDVREAADLFEKRLVGAFVITNRPPKVNERQEEANQLAIQLIHDGLTKLRRAAYHAPFRVHRPEPDWEGAPTGNEEGLPHDILKRMKERGEHYEG